MIFFRRHYNILLLLFALPGTGIIPAGGAPATAVCNRRKSTVGRRKKTKNNEICCIKKNMENAVIKFYKKNEQKKN